VPNLKWDEMIAYLNKTVVPEILEDVGKESVDLLKKHIELFVYNVGDQKRNFYVGGDAEPTGEFGEHVANTKVEKSTNGSHTTTIFHDTDKYTLARGAFVHGSRYLNRETGRWKSTDVRKALPEIINDGRSGKLFGIKGWWRKPRPYFDYFLDEMSYGKMYSNGSFYKTSFSKTMENKFSIKSS